jgi:hypothetical protein
MLERKVSRGNDVVKRVHAHLLTTSIVDSDRTFTRTQQECSVRWLRFSLRQLVALFLAAVSSYARNPPAYCNSICVHFSVKQ